MAGGVATSPLAAPRTQVRWRIIALVFLAYVLMYIDRINISIAARYIIPEYGLSQIEFGGIFSAFVLTYALAQIPGGWLGDRYPKRLLLGAIYLLRSLALALFFMFPPTPLTVVLFGAAMGTLWLGVIPLVNGLVVQIFGLRFLSTLTGIAFLSHQAGSFLGAWGGGYVFDLMGSYDVAWKIGVLVGLAAGTMQLLMNDRPTDRVLAAQAQAA